MWIEGKNFPPFFFFSVLHFLSNGHRRILCEIIAVVAWIIGRVFPAGKKKQCARVKRRKVFYVCSQQQQQTWINHHRPQDELPYAGDRFLHIADFESRHPI